MSVAAIVVMGLSLMAFLPMTYAANLTYGNYGSQVNWGDADHTPRFNVITAAQAHIARVATTSSIATDDYYIHFGPSTDTASNTYDIKIVGTGAGAYVTPAVTFSQVSATNFVAALYYMEANGRPGYNPGDFVYYSENGVLDVVAGSTGFSDIRLTTATALTPSTVSITAGAVVTSTAQTDVTEAASSNQVLPDSVTFPAQTFVLKWGDKNGNGVRDTGDPVLFSGGSATEQTFYVAGDGWLVTAGDGTFGQTVVTTTSKRLPLLNDLSTTALLASTTADVTSTAVEHLFVHFPDPDTTENNILLGDINLANIPTSFANALGTRVSTTSNGYGETIRCYQALRAQIYYIDVDGVSGMSSGDAVYIARPTAGTCTSGTFGGSAANAGVNLYDIRVTAAPNCSACTPGTVVATGNSDLSAYATATKNPVTGYWFVSQDNGDRGNAIPLTLLTSGKIQDANSNGDWDAAEAVYIAAGSTVAIGDTRIYHSTLTDSTTTTKTLVATSDGDIGAAVIAPAAGKKQVYVSGLDATFDTSKSEYVYLSVDVFVNAGDIRGVANGALAQASTVANTDADVASASILNSLDRLFFSWCLTITAITCGAGTPPLLLHTSDVDVTATGIFVSPTGTDHVPWLQLLTEATGTQRLLRWNMGDPGMFDDEYYLSLNGGTAVKAQDLRLVGFDSTHPAGKAVRDSGGETSASATDLTFSTVTLQSLLKFVDVDGNGFTKGDFVIVDVPAALGSANAGTYGISDVRVTPSGATLGATTNAPGTIRAAPDSDNIYGTLGTNCPTADAIHSCGGTDALHIYWFDKNRDNALDFENRGEDRAYLLSNTGASESQSSVITPMVNSVRFTGDGGATGYASNSATSTSAAPVTTVPVTTTPGTTTNPVATTPVTTTPVTTTPTNGTSAPVTTSPSKTKSPGFEGLAVIVGLAGAAVVVAWARRRNES